MDTFDTAITIAGLAVITLLSRCLLYTSRRG